MKVLHSEKHRVTKVLSVVVELMAVQVPISHDP